MNKIYFIKYILILILLIPGLWGCEKQEEPLGDIELPPAPLVSDAESWAVIDASYLRLRERPEANSGLVTTLYRGYVLEIISRAPSKTIMDNEEDYWYQINYDGLQGWVFGSYLSIHDSKEEAEKTARAIRAD